MFKIKSSTIKQVHNTSKILSQTGNSPCILRIKAIARAYGTKYSFVRFFADDNFDILICTQDNLAVLHLTDESFAKIASDFLKISGNSILSDIELPLYNYHKEVGLTFISNDFKKEKLENVSNDISSGFNVLSQVFSDDVNSTNHSQWYTDLSHRIRHNMSKIYTYSGCSATKYCLENKTLFLAQIATLPQSRKQGLATKIISHIAFENNEFDSIILLSRDKFSDNFYHNIGFTSSNKWYYYKVK